MLRQPFLLDDRLMIMKKLIILIIPLSFSLVALGKTPESCIEIKADADRLDCFDSFYNVKDESNPEVKNIPSPVLESKEKQSIRLVETEKLFGLPNKSLKNKKKYATVEASIVAIKHPNKLRVYLELDNDQTWYSVENLRRHRFKVGQNIQITESNISGYKLKVLDKKIKINVRRSK